MDNVTENIKKAFECKQEGRYKEAIDFLYKAFTVDNESVEIMSELAHLYSKINKADRAIDFCEQILNKVPNDFETRFYISSLCKKQKNYDKAEENLMIIFNANYEIIQAAEELFSVLQKANKPEKIIDLYYSREAELKSSVIYCFVGWAFLSLKNTEKAREFYKSAFCEDESNVEAGSRVAEVLFENGLFDDAQILLNQLLKYSENDRIYSVLGEICYIQSDYDKAINYYVLALKLNDKNAQYYYKLGGLYVIKGFYNEAEECYNNAINIDPQNLLYNYTLAYFYFINNKYTLSKHIIEDVLNLDNDYEDALTLKLQILVNENNLAQAGKLVEYLSKKENKTEQMFYSFAIYYSKLGRLEKAVNNIMNAISLNPGSFVYNMELANYYYLLEYFEKAKEICEKILSINNKYIQAYILLSKVYFALKDYKEANENIEQALKLDMNIPEVYYIKGKISYAEKNIPRAIENFKTAISMNPGKVEYYALLAEVYFSVDDYESAYFYYKEAAELDVVNGEYRYYMAKCCEYRNDTESAISNYSIARRLSPLNFLYTEDYVKILCRNNKKKQAGAIIKASMKFFSPEEKKKLENILK